MQTEPKFKFGQKVRWSYYDAKRKWVVMGEPTHNDTSKRMYWIRDAKEMPVDGQLDFYAPEKELEPCS